MSNNLSAKGKGKKMARDFLYRLADSFEVNSKKSESKLKPPPSLLEPEELAAKLNYLTVSESPEDRWPPSSTPFVGGFRPIVPGDVRRMNHTNIDSVSAPSLPVPFGIASPYGERPQSLTMQMALAPEHLPPQVNRVHSNPLPSSHPGEREESNYLNSAPRKSSAAVVAHASASAPIKSDRLDKSNTGLRHSRKASQVQCSGLTKTGKRCTRLVKVDEPITVRARGNNAEELIERFCYQHVRKLLEESGFQSRKNGHWVKFEDWIPSYLQPETQAYLRVEMDRARSQFDEPGYIYTFEIREEHEKDTVKLKVGRTVNLVKRLDEWSKQCGSKEQTLKGFYPHAPESSLMKGRVKAGEKAPWCHRLERLVHIELRDLASTSIYLNPTWPHPESITSEDKFSSAKTNSSSKSAPAPCPDCGNMHKEIFEFRRWRFGENEGKEWERIVKPVIERWGKFVELYV